MRTLDIAIVGLGFGEDFLPVYLAHPGVGRVALVEPSEARLHEIGDRYGVADRFTDLDALLATDEWDAVHILAPVAYHAPQALAVLRSGRHCACAVPMATELDDLQAIVEEQRSQGLTYMMMETSVYGREYLAVADLHARGRLGTLSAYRGFHLQNLDGYPSYWRGYPPMKYVTHAIAPLLALTGTTVRQVVGMGTGRLTPERVGDHDNPFPTQVGLFSLTDSDVVGEVSLSFFQLARTYIEGFDVYGDAGSVEWPRDEGGALRLHELQPLDPTLPDRGLRGRRSMVTDLATPARPLDLPAELVAFLDDFDVPDGAGGTTRRRAEHGGSHPHLVHEFVTSVLEGRPPAIDAARSAAWTAPGICAHESSLAGGAPIDVPEYLTEGVPR